MVRFRKMRKSLIFQITSFLLILIIAGCTTQGRLTYLVFEESENYIELKTSMEELKIEGYDGSIQQQFSALKEVRYISKYMDERSGDSVRRDLAVSALVFLAFASDDGDVNDRSLSRLETLLEDEEDWPLYLQMTTVDSLADLVIGHNGFKEKHDGQWMNFGIRSSDREDALEFLMDSFEDQNEELRHHTVMALGRILRAEPSLETCPYNICDEDVRKNLEEWEQGREVKQVLPANADPNAVESGAYGPESKMVPIDERQEWQEESDELKQMVWKALEDWLEDSKVSELHQSIIVRWAGEVQNFSMLPEMEESFQEIMARWAENEDIPSSIRQLLKASQERVTLYGVPATKEPVPASTAFLRVWMLSPEFVETHLDSFFQQQIGRQQSGLLVGRPRPDDILTADYEDTPEGKIRKEIIMDQLRLAFERGMVLENADVLGKLGTALEGSESIADLASMVRVVEVISPSIRERNWSPMPLLDALKRGAEASEQIQRKRLYVKAISAGSEQFPEEVNLTLSSMDVDLLTRQMFELSSLNTDETL